jgi:hypothetical protein
MIVMTAIDLSPAASRRTMLSALGSTGIAAFFNWLIGTRRQPEITIVDGWILAKSDLD